ncbi:MAG: hypothetical protein RJA70_2815 [Pseudomonadota bacterium]|jgi:uncharacterized protein YecE (DUF72 family)
MRLSVGQTYLKGSFSKYQSQLDFLELTADPQRLPSLAKLKEVRAKASEDFVFSVALTEHALIPGEQAAQRLAYGLKVAKTLRARWLVLRTASNFRPSPQNEKQLAAWVESLKSEAFALAWEPHGLWEPRQAARVAENLGLQLVQDAVNFEAGGITYLRLAGLGATRRMGESLLEKIAVRAVTATELYLALAVPGAVSIRRQLQELFEYDGEDDELDDELAALDADHDAEDVEDDVEDDDDAEDDDDDADLEDDDDADQETEPESRG